jgi:hypothetical protein
MRRESFLDHETAKVLCDATVPVKVDRELRPDVDALYMSYVMATTGSGGWPMSVFASPDGVPIFGGTYFPPLSTHPRLPSFRDVIATVRRSWILSREHTLGVAADALEFLRDGQRLAAGTIDRAVLDSAAGALLAAADRDNGGFGSAPKFPQAPVIGFLLAYHELTGDAQFLALARDAVLGMVRGGIYDQVGGGLFRYSVDAEWLVPHFEKMLSDNALLLSTLAALHRIEPRDEYVRVAQQTAGFLARELTRPGGGFYSSLDAETGGAEGATYLWTAGQLREALTPQELSLAEEYLGVTGQGNTGDGLTIITRRGGRGPDPGEAAALDAVLDTLLAARTTRPQPAVIDNTLVSWNALASSGLIEAGAAMSDAAMLHSGLETLDWLTREGVWGQSVLHAIGDRSVAGVQFLEDATDVVASMLSAVEFAGRTRLLKSATRLHAAAIERFATGHGFAMSAGDPSLPLVPVRTDDSPTPGGAATLAENALRLARLTGDDSHREVCDRALAQYGRTARAAPHMAGHALAVATMRERSLS